MTQSLRIKIAAAATAVAIGGLTAAGLAVRGGDGGSADRASAVRPEVVHRKKMRRIPVREPQAQPASVPASRAAPEPEPAVVAQPAAQPAVVSEAQPVTSQVSPTGGGYDDEEAEDEGGEGEDD